MDIDLEIKTNIKKINQLTKHLNLYFSPINYLLDLNKIIWYEENIKQIAYNTITITINLTKEGNFENASLKTKNKTKFKFTNKQHNIQIKNKIYYEANIYEIIYEQLEFEKIIGIAISFDKIYINKISTIISNIIYIKNPKTEVMDLIYNYLTITEKSKHVFSNIRTIRIYLYTINK